MNDKPRSSNNTDCSHVSFVAFLVQWSGFFA